MPSKTTQDNLQERFWSKVDIRSDDECWEWKNHVDDWGYGQFRYFRKMERSHRVSWIIVNGEIPNGLRVLHKCDNPSCCNPHHLFLGTDLDNALDREAKGRGVRNPLFGTQHPQHGTNNWQSRLNETKVREIRNLHKQGISHYRIADNYGISPSTAYKVISGITWKWLK